MTQKILLKLLLGQLPMEAPSTNG